MPKTARTKPEPPTPVNELRVDYLSAAGLNPWAAHDSSSRIQMMGQHVTQALVIEGATDRRCQTGIEREFGRFTFNVKIPCDAEILRVIQKYPTTLGRNAIRENSLTAIIYEEIATKKIGVVLVPRYHCQHQHFGFKYVYKPALNRITVGQALPKGTILADSPCVDERSYRLGLEGNVAFMSVPGIIEDGVIISRSFAKKMRTTGFEKRVADWGSHVYPLNLYGNDEEYKPFPDIGDTVREDGLLFALRRYDPMLAPVEMTPSALREPDYTFDQLIYAKPGAKIIDVSVRHDARSSMPPTPVGMETQAERYYHAELAFYREIIATYNELNRKHPNKRVPITEEFHVLLREAMLYQPDRSKMRAVQMVQRTPLDDWRVEITFEYTAEPTDAFKLTDFHGGL